MRFRNVPRPLAAFVLLCGAYGWVMFAATAAGHDGIIGPAFNAMGADWVIWQTAAREYFGGDLTRIYNQLWVTHAVNGQFAVWLSAPLPYPVFPYPPASLLLIAPFAALPMPLSLLAFEAMTFATLAWALTRLAPSRRTWLLFLAAAILAPAASNNLLAGQNGFLTAAILLGGVSLLDTRPLLAGGLFGLMIVKPQFLPLLGAALLAARQRGAFAAMIASVLALVAASAWLFGGVLWIDWIGTFLIPQHGTGINGNDWGHMWDNSVSTCAALLGAPPALAALAQAIAALVALVSVWLAFRGGLPVTGRFSVLACAVLLASPHLSPYDLELLALVAAVQISRLPEGTRPLALLLPLAGWIAPLLSPPRVNLLGFLLPLVLAGLIISASRTAWPGPASPSREAHGGGGGRSWPSGQRRPEGVT
jgi:hypothetical protein